MRAGGCSIHQSLTPDATTIVKQAISLARRRGHAQVTPLHVANTMLSSSTGLLRSACLQSHSHPLQCKALELCFNVALNRLPAASSSSPLLPPQHPPSLSNALIAAFKRAQAHQRRGSIENQQQPLLAVKIELEQLIVSILDDPSVSRVMREAGFSSTQVKSNVEQAISLEPNPNPNPTRTTPEKADEDITSLVESLMSSKKRSIVVVGECLASTEGVVKGLMERVDKGQVPEILRNLQLITLPLLSFSGMSRGEVEQKLSELRCLLMKNCCVGKGAVLYLEDIKWVAEFRANSYGERGIGFYCPVEHVIMEIGRLVFAGINGGEDGGRGGGGRFWLMGISTYQTYMRCKIGNPSLEIVWGLQPLTIPVGSLELSLNCDNCDTQSLHKSSSISGAWPILEDTAGNQLTCCTNFPIKFEKDDAQASTTSTLPSWLQHYKEKNKRDAKDQDCLRIHNHISEITLHFSSNSPSSSISSYNHHNTSISLHQSHHPWKQNQVWLSEGISTRGFSNNSRAFPFTISNNSSSPNPNLTSTANTMDMEPHCKFKEVNAENLKILCNALERKVPWQKAIIPEIASTILQCRAGMKRRNKEDTWLFFQGGDIEGKEKIARELASLVFGYHTSFFALGLSSSSSTKSDSTDDVKNKRSRSEASHGFLEMLAKALRENPHRVFLVEDIEQVDFHSQVGIKSAIERGSFWSLEGGEVAVKDAIVILSCEAFDSRSRGCSPPVKQKIEREEGNGEEVSGKENDSYLCLDLNLCAADNETAELWCCGESERLLGAVDRAFFFKMPEDL